MPIEIRELIIKAEISDKTEKVEYSGSKQSNNLNKQQIIQECVDQVLEILKKEKER